MSEEYYEPDPNAPVHHKLNPCHCDHVDALDNVQYILEGFASHCRCCSGVRIILLMVAFVLCMFDVPLLADIGTAMFAIVLCAIVYGTTTEAFCNRGKDDNGNT